MSGLSMSIFKEPQAEIFKKRRMSSLLAAVCGECGYVELYAKNLHYFFDEGKKA